MTTEAPVRQDTDVDTDVDELFGSIVSEEFKHKKDDSDDHDTFSHYVNKEDIIRSATTGAPVYAVCGKKWTPKKSPEKYPICPTCKDIYEQMQSGEE